MAGKGGVTVVVVGEDKTGEVFKQIQKHMDETKAKAKETSESLGQIGEVLRVGLAAAGIAIGVAEVVRGFKEMVNSTMEAGVQLGHLSQQTGISVANLSILKYAAQATGVDFDVLTRGFKKLAVTTIEADSGNKNAAKGFAMVGISVEQLRSKGDDMQGVLSMLADKFHAMPDGMVKSDAAAKIFGARMGSEMIPILDALGGKMDELKAEAQALGVVWD
jgi:DNA-binding Xre family transcriptional regulator